MEAGHGLRPQPQLKAATVAAGLQAEKEVGCEGGEVEVKAEAVGGERREVARWVGSKG